MGRIKRVALPVLLDASIIVALLLPSALAYVLWPVVILALLFLTIGLAISLVEQGWIFRIVRDPVARVALGLQHASLTALQDAELPVLRSFTHARDRFTLVLEAGHGDKVDAVHDAVTQAIRRVLAGERSLAYHPGCGTSELALIVSLWFVAVSCTVFSIMLGGSISVCFALGVIALRIWAPWEVPLGLLAQRLVTVSTAFESAVVVEVREVVAVEHRRRPRTETWFAVAVDIRVRASAGGIVAPTVWL